MLQSTHYHVVMHRKVFAYPLSLSLLSPTLNRSAPLISRSLRSLNGRFTLPLRSATVPLRPRLFDARFARPLLLKFRCYAARFFSHLCSGCCNFCYKTIDLAGTTLREKPV